MAQHQNSNGILPAGCEIGKMQAHALARAVPQADLNATFGPKIEREYRIIEESRRREQERCEREEQERLEQQAAENAQAPQPAPGLLGRIRNFLS